MEHAVSAPAAWREGRGVAADDQVVRFEVGLGLKRVGLVYFGISMALFALFTATTVLKLFGGIGPVAGGVLAGLVSAAVTLFVAPRLASRRHRIEANTFQNQDLDAERRWQLELNALQRTVQAHGQIALGWGGKRNLFRITAERLLRYGAGGMVFRLTATPMEAPLLPEPLLVPIEPIPLSDLRASFIDLQGAPITFRQRLRESWILMRQMFGSRRSVWYLIVGAMILGFAILLLQAAVAVARLAGGRFSEGLWPIVLIGGIVLGQYFWRSVRPDRWPGCERRTDRDRDALVGRAVAGAAGQARRRGPAALDAGRADGGGGRRRVHGATTTESLGV